MLKKHRLWAGITSVLVLILALVIFLGNLAFTRAGDVNLFLGTMPPAADVTDDTNYFPSDYKNKDEMRAALKEYIIDSQVQGSVLLKNEANALPLATGVSVTLFGSGVVNPVFHGGSGGPAAKGTMLYDALKAQGVKVNDEVINKLKSEKTDYGKTGLIGEVSASAYESVKTSFASHNDAAIFVMRRFGGEEGELNHGLDGIWQDGPAGVPELSLHDEEKGVLNLIKNGGFKKIIVLINSGYAVELGWLEEYGVDACMWIGYPGESGMEGVAKALVGKADPSGRLVDTYAASSLSSPAIQNAGDFTFTNLNGLYKNKYLVYAEGIYLGYKYYETRYQDCVLGLHDAKNSKGIFAGKGTEWNYADEMDFTFGSGGSYADFTQELKSVEWNRETHEVTAKVTVTNNGDEAYKGKSRDVVQLYVQLPWEEGHAEKSAIQLADFEKTIELEGGEDTEVTLKFSDYLFATYDEKAANGADSAKKGCYVFDEGDYYFAIGDNAHDALNNVLAKRGETGMYDENGNPVTGDADKAISVNLAELDNVTYAKSRFNDGVVVSNLFEDRDLNYFIKDKVTYLTRADWKTFPEAVKNVTATDEIKDLMENAQYEKPADAPSISQFKYGQKNGIKFVEMRNVDFDEDEKWEKFIDQLTVAELCQIVGDQMKMDAISSIDMPAFAGGDGPDGHQMGVLFNAEMVASSSFSKEVLKNRGKFFAEESYYLGFRQIYGPGANLHRTPYSGRNFEYYSEDANLSYICGQIQTGESAKRGLVTHIKHFCGNDQETNRHGAAQFMTEQAYRQGPLKGFEGALAGDNSLGLMSAYNRIGCVPTAADYQTMQLVLRDEWGFKGINMTDSSKDSVSYMATADCMHAGTNQFNNDIERVSAVKKLIVNDKDGYIWLRLRQTAKNFLYAMSHGMLANGLSKDTVVQQFVPWWQPAIISACVMIGVVTLAAAGMFVYSAYGDKLRAKRAAQAVDETDEEED